MLTHKIIVATLTVALFLGLVPGASAQGDVVTEGYCETQPVAAIALVLKAGTTTGCLLPYQTIVESPTEQIYIGASLSGPDNALGVLVTSTWSMLNIQGCTASAASVGDVFNAAVTKSMVRWTITMTSNQCNGQISGSLNFGAVPVGAGNFHAVFNIRVDEPNFEFQCAATGGTPGAFNPNTNLCDTAIQVEIPCSAASQLFSQYTPSDVCSPAKIMNFDYLCEASGATPSNSNPSTVICNPPTMTVSLDPITGELTIHQDEACGASIPCMVQVAGIDNASFNSTVNNDFARVVLDWFPLWFGVIGLFVAIWRKEGLNPDALIGSSVAFIVALFTCPFPHWLDPIGIAYRFLVFGAALWTMLKWGEYRKPKNETDGSAV